MKQFSLMLIVVMAIAGAGCESVGTAAQSKRNQGALLGGVLGAATGAVIGNQSGNSGEGAAIGAGLGAIGGGLMGNAMEEQDKQNRRQYPPANAPAETQMAPAGRVKFSPATGKEYPEHMKYDPETGVELKYKQ